MKQLHRWQWPEILTFILVVGLLILLPILAIMQYRWLGQVSEGERQRMQTNLRTATLNFSRDFDNEINNILQTFLINPQKSSETIPFYATRYQEWLTKTAHPRLIKDLFIIDDCTNQQGQLLKLAPDHSQFVPIAWPAEFTKFQHYCQTRENKSANSEGVIEVVEVNPLANLPMLLIPENSHLPMSPMNFSSFISINSGSTPHSLKDKVEMDFSKNSRYLMVLLDLDYLRQVWLPGLTAHYLTNGDRLDYTVAVIDSRDKQQLIYCSDPQATTETFAHNDMAQELCSLRIALESSLDDTIPKDSSPRANAQYQTIYMTERIHKISKTPSQNGASKDKTTTINLIQSGAKSLPPKVMQIVSTGDQQASPWQLVVKHHAGSLDLAVNQLRQRNLMVSFGILILLALSMGMILLSARRAQQLAQQQMEFVAGVSHELRTPLAVICSAGENLADGIVREPAQLKRYGTLIKGEGQRLTDMVEQVMEFAGRQSQRRTYQLQPTPIREVVEQAISMCRSMITEHQAEVVAEIPPELPLVQVDALALQRALQNLINNAMKYGGDSPWLKISAQVSHNRKYIELAVADRGLGIAPTELPHIFEPFYRGAEVVASQIRGSGLGLSLVQQAMTACSGKVTVASQVGQGSTFTLHLPIAQRVTGTAIIANESLREGYE